MVSKREPGWYWARLRQSKDVLYDWRPEWFDGYRWRPQGFRLKDIHYEIDERQIIRTPPDSGAVDEQGTKL